MSVSLRYCRYCRFENYIFILESQGGVPLLQNVSLANYRAILLWKQSEVTDQGHPVDVLRKGHIADWENVSRLLGKTFGLLGKFFLYLSALKALFLCFLAA